jgi:hypothetical protein
MEKVIFCLLIFLIMSLLFMFNKSKFKEFFDVINLPDLEYDKRLYIGDDREWTSKLTKGDLGVSGITETRNYCIHKKGSDPNQNSDCLTQDEIFNKVKKNYFGKSILKESGETDNKICLNTTKNIDLPYYSQGDGALCITEQDAKFLKNIRSYLKNKTKEMRKRIINSKPYCNWHGASISSTGGYEYGIYVCQDNMLTHYYPSRFGNPNWKSDKLDE